MTETLSRKEAQEARKIEPLSSDYSKLVLLGLQQKPVFQGVEVDRGKRKKRNKVARRQRKASRV